MVENRRCRDVLFLLLFVAYWVGMFIVCGIAFQSGQVSLPVSTCDCLGQQLHATV
jgi:choline transporter-like protein 2/4/5